MHAKHKPLLSFLTLLLLLTGSIALLIHSELIGLGPDEAQYWTWSQALDWGYYSKPPAIAWQIWTGTQLFGNSEFGVRALSLVFGFALSLSVYFLAIACGMRRAYAATAGVAFAFSPLGFLSSFLAVTDGGMVLCWNLASIVIASSLRKSSLPHYFLVGTILLIGALFKWTIYLFWPLILLLWPFYPSLRSWRLLPAVFLSLTGLAPSLYWNSTHQWVTFRHVSNQITGSQPGGVQSHGNPLEFLGMEIALVSPVLFALLICGAIFLIKRRREVSAPLWFCGGSTLFCLAAYFLASFFQKIQGNWCVFIYPSAFVFLTWSAYEWLPNGRAWLRRGILLSLVLCIGLVAIPWVQKHRLFSQAPIPYSLNAFHHNLGWNRLENALLHAGYDPNLHFLFGDKYQTASILSFYGPKQNRAYFLNLQGVRLNQFSFWPGMAEEQLGKDGFFIVIEQMPRLEEKVAQQKTLSLRLLQPYFRQVEFVEMAPLFEAYGTAVKVALLFRCVEYNGLQPPHSNLY